MPNSVPLDLGASRVIVIRQRGHAYTFKLRQIEDQDWIDYFDSITTTTERLGKDTVRRSDAGAAGVKLVEDVLVGADGYKLPATVDRLEDVPEWKSKIPMQHRLAIAEILLDVKAMDLDDSGDALALGLETVALEALWNSDADGNIRRHTQLLHHFETPSAEHQRRFLRDASRSRVVGGTRTGRTVWQGAQKTLAGIYDELITGVEGYVRSGLELKDKREIVQHMDMRHKVAAAERLFAPAQAEETDEDGEIEG